MEVEQVRRRCRVGLAFALLVLMAAPVSSRGEVVVSRERVVGMLSAYESLPAREEWLHLGGDAVTILIEVANDSRELTFRRVRALTVLGYFPDPRAVEALESVVSSADAPPSYRRSALLALANASPRRALAPLEEAVNSPDPLMRQVAIKALGQMPGPEASALLEARRAKEDRAFLRERIERAIAERK
jgi:HEAT repeat protein